jgi:SPP1 gp7 family putative phage head morphogenesis protein
MTANDALGDAAIRHAIYLSRLSNHEVRDVVRIIDRDIRPGLERELARLMSLPKSSPWKSNRYKALLSKLDFIVKAGVAKIRDGQMGEMLDLGKLEAQWQASVLGKAVPLDIKWKVPSAGMLREASLGKPYGGALLKDWWQGLESATTKRIRSTITAGLTAGEPMETISRRVLGTAGDAFRGGSDMATMRRQARSVVRTSVSGIASNARNEMYAANQEVLAGRRWLSVLDDRTSDICMSLDGQVFPVTSGPSPPAHHQCRSVDVPVTKSWQELGIKGASDKRVGGRAYRDVQSGLTKFSKENITYGQWLKTQPAVVQNDILGPTRAKLFRSGKVKFDRFFDDGRRLNLSELAKRENLTLTKGTLTPKPKAKVTPKATAKPKATPKPKATAKAPPVAPPKAPPVAPPKPDISTPEGMRAEANRLYSKEMAEMAAQRKTVEAQRAVMDAQLDFDYYKKERARIQRGFASRAEIDIFNQKVTRYLEEKKKWQALEVQFVKDSGPLNAKLHNLMFHGEKKGMEIDAYFAPKGRAFRHEMKTKRALEPDAALKSKTREASEFINKMIPQGPEKSWSDSLSRMEVLRMKKGNRAFAREGVGLDGGGLAALAADDPVRVFVHEFMHLVEDDHFRAEVRMFLKYRSRRLKNIDPNAKVFWMEEVVSVNSVGDKGWRDQWLDAYTGRRYESAMGQGLHGTEVASMLTEGLYADPSRLMLQDPEAFDFIVSLLRRVPVEKHGWYRDLPKAMKEWIKDQDYR